MNPTAIYSKSGKGVQEASGKTSLLKRPDRAVLSAIDGRATLAEVAQRVGRPFDAALQAVITQLDKDGFIREVSSGAPAAPPSKPGVAPTSKPGAAPASRPSVASRPAPTSSGELSELDFTSIGGIKPATMRPLPPPQPISVPPVSRPAAPTPPPPPPAAPAPAPAQAKEQQSALTKAREEAEARAAAERERLKLEAEARARAEMEVQLRLSATQKIRQEAEAKAKEEAEAKVRAAREAAVKAAAEAKARAEAEAKAKLEAERRAREELERKLEAERKAREEAERKATEEAERKAREEAERRARDEAERKAREEAERRAREEAERKVREEAERKEEAERAERRRRQEEEEERQAEEARVAAAAAAAIAQAAQAAPPREAKRDELADSLLADLDAFTGRGSEHRKAREEAERNSSAEAERRESEQAEARRLEDDERRRNDEARRAKDEEERRAQEEERRRREADEIRRKAEAATAAAMAKEGKGADEDIPISDEDLDMDEVRREEAAIEKAKAKKPPKPEKKPKAPAIEARPRPRRESKAGRRIGVTLFLLLLIAIGAAHVVSFDTADYERAATEALGRPVKIGSARLWLFTGLELRMQGVRVGDARIAHVTAMPAITSLFNDRKEFSRIELDGFTLPQSSLGDALFTSVRGDNFRVEHIVVKSLALPGPAALPKTLQADMALNAKGAMRMTTVRGPDGLVAKITPKDGGFEIEAVAAGFTLPIGPAVTLSNFAMKATATPRSMHVADWGGSIFNGAISGTANIRWGAGWIVDGVVTVRNINAAVFAPALLSSGTGEGTAKFSMNASDPSGLAATSRLDGSFTITKGTLGSFDLARFIQTNGKQAQGTTQFVEMNGQATYDRGSVALRNVTIGAGALNAGASADIARNGALSGRIVADVRTASQVLRATLLLGGTVKDPQVRN